MSQARVKASGIATAVKKSERRHIESRGATPVERNPGVARLLPARSPARMRIRGIVVGTLAPQIRSMALPLADGSFNRFDGLIATPHVVETSMFSQRNTIAVWEYGGTTSSGAGELMTHTFTLQRPPLQIGGEYWFLLEEDWLMATPVFVIINVSKIASIKKYSIPNAQLCNTTDVYGRWLSEAPLMEWHSTVMKNFNKGGFKLDAKLRVNYNTALDRWASAQSKAPSKAPIPADWSATSALWPEFDPGDASMIKKGLNWSDFFELDDITEGTNIPSSTHAMNVGEALSMTYMFDMPPMPGKNTGDEGDLTIAWVDHRKNGFVDTCLGVFAGKFIKTRTMWNANAACPWDGDPTKTFSTFGIWMHEVGHILGLEHRRGCLGKEDAVMVGGIDIARSQKIAFLTPDDTARIQKLYPRETAFENGMKPGC